jgi:hypothetical protein
MDNVIEVEFDYHNPLIRKRNQSRKERQNELRVAILADPLNGAALERVAHQALLTLIKLDREFDRAGFTGFRSSNWNAWKVQRQISLSNDIGRAQRLWREILSMRLLKADGRL